MKGKWPANIGIQTFRIFMAVLSSPFVSVWSIRMDSNAVRIRIQIQVTKLMRIRTRSGSWSQKVDFLHEKYIKPVNVFFMCSFD
jgi:hypothetical protein